MVVAFSTLIILAKMTRDVQAEMVKSVGNMKTTIMEVQKPEKKKPKKNVEDVVKKKEPEKVEQVSYNTSKTKTFMRNYRQGDSPMIDKVDLFFQGDVMKGKLALAIAGNETAFGTVGKGHEYFNAWGYLCNDVGDCGWRSWEYSIPRYMEVADNYLSVFDGTKESLMKIQRMGYHPVSEDKQIAWSNNIMWFYNNL
jgi:hypothetical protein